MDQFDLFMSFFNVSLGVVKIEPGNVTNGSLTNYNLLLLRYF